MRGNLSATQLVVAAGNLKGPIMRSRYRSRRRTTRRRGTMRRRGRGSFRRRGQAGRRRRGSVRIGFRM